ncbi:peptidase M12 [Actinoplanes utahensis]|uniref:peptidase M12 n=1 Tax=Actinoplanes utahensis TaxID=1869 RepID=UPI000A97D517|nr:peptidase M12 [Actinoplanes utahensis]GIF27320.1 hypothetical protein Aut01nite_03060 [Actinoplanes utahensis]
MQTPTCSIKMLPAEEWVAAAEQASEINPANAPSLDMLRQAAPDTVIDPQDLAILTASYWGPRGAHLTVGFLDNPEPELRRRILSHMNAWGRWADISFVESATDPQVRIARMTGPKHGGFWSYLGTDILSIAPGQPTMNFEGFTIKTPEPLFVRVVRHETGHTLGFPHEHLRKEIIDRIDRDMAIAWFGEKMRWSPERVIHNVLTPLRRSNLMATAEPDPHSIMCYWLPGNIMKDGLDVQGGSDVSPQDARFVARLYPK